MAAPGQRQPERAASHPLEQQMIPTCESLIDNLHKSGILLSQQLEEEISVAQSSAKDGLKSGRDLIEFYIANLDSAKEALSRDRILRAVNAFTRVNKGLSDQGWLRLDSPARNTAWNVTKAAIEAAACLRDNGA